MSTTRAVAVVLSLVAGGQATVAAAQYQQPWVGEGISARQERGTAAVLAARQDPAPVVMKSPAPVVAGPTRFTVRVENISTGEALKLSNGKSAPFVSAPVLWVIHTGGTNPVFTGGARDAGEGLELLAETGDPSKLVASLARKPGVVADGGVARPVGETADGPLTPGQRYEFEISAEPGQFLSAAWMFGQSNDLFYSNDRPIALFDASGKPVTTDLTAHLALWDAGTELNEEPGLGANQGPRQANPDDGVAEAQGIAHVRDKFSYPRTPQVLRVTLAPVDGAVSSR